MRHAGTRAAWHLLARVVIWVRTVILRSEESGPGCAMWSPPKWGCIRGEGFMGLSRKHQPGQRHGESRRKARLFY